MRTVKQWERIWEIHKLILTQQTGNPAALAFTLGFGESQLFKILEAMRIYGFPLAYSRKNQTYFYTDFCEFEFRRHAVLRTSNGTKNLIDIEINGLL